MLVVRLRIRAPTQLSMSYACVLNEVASLRLTIGQEIQRGILTVSMHLRLPRVLLDMNPVRIMFMQRDNGVVMEAGKLLMRIELVLTRCEQFLDDKRMVWYAHLPLVAASKPVM